MKRVVITNTMVDLYKEKSFNFLPYIMWQKFPSWADFYEYRIRIGWLCWNVTITLKDESEKWRMT